MTASILIALALTVTVAAILYLRFGSTYQRKRDRQFIQRLRTSGGVIALKTNIVEQCRLRDAPASLLRERLIEDSELLIGRGYLIPVALDAAFHNPSILSEGVKEMTWSIPLQHCEATGNDLVIECTLPSDESSVTHLRFPGLLAGEQRHTVLAALGKH